LAGNHHHRNNERKAGFYSNQKALISKKKRVVGLLSPTVSDLVVTPSPRLLSEIQQSNRSPCARMSPADRSRELRGQLMRRLRRVCNTVVLIFHVGNNEMTHHCRNSAADGKPDADTRRRWPRYCTGGRQRVRADRRNRSHLVSGAVGAEMLPALRQNPKKTFRFFLS